VKPEFPVLGPFRSQSEEEVGHRRRGGGADTGARALSRGASASRCPPGGRSTGSITRSTASLNATQRDAAGSPRRRLAGASPRAPLT